MWILALEALVALGMLVLIVWLTMGGTKRRDTEVAERDRPPDDPPEDRK
jgi:hypothetical protein